MRPTGEFVSQYRGPLLAELPLSQTSTEHLLSGTAIRAAAICGLYIDTQGGVQRRRVQL